MIIVINEYSFNINPKATANRLKELRKKRNLSLSEMSDSLVEQNKYLFNIENGNDISETIRSWESGKRRPSREKMIALCNFFKISLQELVLPYSICKAPKPQKIKLSSNNIRNISDEEFSIWLENQKNQNAWLDYLIQKLVSSYLNNNDICLFSNILFGSYTMMGEISVDPISFWNERIITDLDKNGKTKFDMSSVMKEKYIYWIYRNILFGFEYYNRKNTINLVYDAIIMNYNNCIKLIQLLNELERSIVFTSLILAHYNFSTTILNFFCDNKTKFLESIASFVLDFPKDENKITNLIISELKDYSYDDYMKDAILVTNESSIKIKENYNCE